MQAKKAEATSALNIYLFVVMDAQLNIEDGRFVINLLPQTAHSATIRGQTGCGKTVFILDLLESPYWGFFQHIVILCPTVRHNKTYQQRLWFWTDQEVYLFDPGEHLHDYLRAFYHVFIGEPTLYIIDDCSALTALTKKKDMLSMLAFSGRHAEQPVSVLTQKYNSVLKDLREQTHWVCLFHCKDRDSFEECLRENDVIPSRKQGNTGDEAPSEKPVATTYLQSKEEPDRVQNTVKGSPRLQREVKQGGMGYFLTEKH